ncbi:ribonuclease H-like domain-containing protein [Aspergillus heterothallicus]
MGLYCLIGRLITRSSEVLPCNHVRPLSCNNTAYSIGKRTIYTFPKGRICSPYTTNYGRSSGICWLLGRCKTLPSKPRSRPTSRNLSTWFWNRSRLAPAGKSQLGEPSTSQGTVSGVKDGDSSDVFPKYWSHRLFKSPAGDDIAVHYCQTLESTEQVAQLFLKDTLLGFDMEWQPDASMNDSIQDNASLIQLASPDRIALFQISKFQPGETRDNLVSPTLKRIMESSNITKAGVAIRSDSTRLRTFLGINSRGLFELSHLYRLLKYYHQPSQINKRLVAMSKQVDEHFGLPLMKDRSVRCSNWSSSLTESQIHYAAADAYAGYQLFCIMDMKRRGMKPIPPLPAHAELNLPIRTFGRPHSDGRKAAKSPALAPVSSTESLIGSF